MIVKKSMGLLLRHCIRQEHAHNTTSTYARVALIKPYHILTDFHSSSGFCNVMYGLFVGSVLLRGLHYFDQCSRLFVMPSSCQQLLLNYFNFYLIVFFLSLSTLACVFISRKMLQYCCAICLYICNVFVISLNFT